MWRRIASCVRICTPCLFNMATFVSYLVPVITRAFLYVMNVRKGHLCAGVARSFSFFFTDNGIHRPPLSPPPAAWRHLRRHVPARTRLASLGGVGVGAPSSNPASFFSAALFQAASGQKSRRPGLHIIDGAGTVFARPPSVTSSPGCSSFLSLFTRGVARTAAAFARDRRRPTS